MDRAVICSVLSDRRSGSAVHCPRWARCSPILATLLAIVAITIGCVAYFLAQSRQAEERLLQQQQREAAFDTALRDAISGDAESALQSIAAAESLDVKPARVSLLRGLVERGRGRPREAVMHFESARKTQPSSIAVNTSLAAAYSDVGNWDKRDELQIAFEKAEPKTNEDRLFLALAFAESDPERAIQILDSTPMGFRQSAIARMVRAPILRSLSDLKGRNRDAMSALEEIDRSGMDGNPWAHALRIKAAMAALRAPDASEAYKQFLQIQMESDYERLREVPDNRVAVKAIGDYLFAFERDDELIELSRNARERGSSDYNVDLYAAAIQYGRGEYADALDLLVASSSDTVGADGIVHRGIVLAAMPDRRDEAVSTLQDATQKCTSGRVLSSVGAHLLLLGPEDLSQTRRVAHMILTRMPARIPQIRDRWHVKLLRMHSGVRLEEDLLEQAKGSRFNLCQAYYNIGLRRLAQLKRSEAKAMFQKAVETDVYFLYEYIWSKAFLMRIDDPEWLPWLPMDSPTDQPGAPVR